MSLFTEKAPKVMWDLIRDLDLNPFQAAGILGNIGTESGGFVYMQEIKPTAGDGGYGWCQWTGPRRTDFMNYCSLHNLKPESDEANYGYLKEDLKGPYSYALAAVKKASNFVEATIAFETHYEYAGVKNYSNRVAYARQAFFAWLLPLEKANT